MGVIKVYVDTFRSPLPNLGRLPGYRRAVDGFAGLLDGGELAHVQGLPFILPPRLIYRCSL